MSNVLEMSNARKNHLDHKSKTLLTFLKENEDNIRSWVKIESSFCDEETGIVYASVDSGSVDVSAVSHLLLGTPVGA